MMGRGGRSGLDEFFLGSVSNYVLHHVPCLVLAVGTRQTLTEKQEQGLV